MPPALRPRPCMVDVEYHVILSESEENEDQQEAGNEISLLHASSRRKDYIYIYS